MVGHIQEYFLSLTLQDQDLSRSPFTVLSLVYFYAYVEHFKFEYV